MIDRKLNYGRHIIRSFSEESAPFDDVLDIAAGSGDDLAIAGGVCPGARLHALECYTPNIEKLQSRGVDVHDVNIERDAFGFPDESVDLVIANQILEHTKELFWIFHEITRVLTVGGRLIIGVPNLASLHNRILLLFGRQPSPIKSNSAHIRGFTKGDLLRFLDCWGGYELMGFKGSNFYPFPPFIAGPLADRLPSMAWGAFLLVEKVKPYDGAFLRFPGDNQLETNFYTGLN